jgi:hypothetical protein
MKKLIAVFAALLAITGFAAAQSPTFSAEGGVYFDVGMDADNLASGFVVGLDKLRFKVDVTDKNTVEKAASGDEQVYGDIKISGLRVATDNDSSHKDTYLADAHTSTTDWTKRPLYLLWDQLQAKIVLGPLFSATFLYNNYNNFHHALQLTSYNGDGYYLKNAYDYYLFDNTYGEDNATGSLNNGWETEGVDQEPTNRVFFKASNYKFHDHVTQDAYLNLTLSLPSMADITAMVASYKTYDDTSRFTDSYSIAAKNSYSGILSASLKAVPKLTAVAAASFDIGVPDFGSAVDTSEYSPLAFSGRVGYEFSLADELTITPQLAFDCQLPDADLIGGYVESTDGFDFAAAGGIQVDFYKSTFTLNAGFGYDGSTNADPVNSLRATAALVFKTVENLNVKAAFEYIDDNLDNDTNNDGKIDSLDAIDATYGAALEAAYSLPISENGILMPYGKFSADTKEAPNCWNLSGSGIPMYAQAGVVLSGIVTNTKFDLYWHSNDLSDIENGTKGSRVGEIVFRTTISF